MTVTLTSQESHHMIAHIPRYAIAVYLPQSSLPPYHHLQVLLIPVFLNTSCCQVLLCVPPTMTWFNSLLPHMLLCLVPTSQYMLQFLFLESNLITSTICMVLSSLRMLQSLFLASQFIIPAVCLRSNLPSRMIVWLLIQHVVCIYLYCLQKLRLSLQRNQAPWSPH